MQQTGPEHPQLPTLIPYVQRSTSGPQSYGLKWQRSERGHSSLSSASETQEAGRCLWEILPAVVWTAAGGCWRLHDVEFWASPRNSAPQPLQELVPVSWPLLLWMLFFTLYLLEFSLLQGDLVASCSFTLYHSETFVSAFSNNAPIDRWRHLLDLFFSKAKKYSSFRLSPVHQRNTYATDSV